MGHLSFIDWCVIVTTITGVVAVFYAVLAYHRPPVVGKPGKTAPPPTRNLVPIICAVVAWAAVAAYFVDQHWLSADQAAETPLSAENARLTVSRWQAIFSNEGNHPFS
jgi:hypothetical protein